MGGVGVRSIQNFHMDFRGWSDIAYSFVIDRDTLVVYEGRGWGVRPGSQSNYNTGTWSVCVMGSFNSHIPSEGLLDTIVALIRHGVDLGHLPRTLTGGHRDAPGQSTECPGSNLHGSIPAIRNLLASPDMSQPLQSWSRIAYQWAMSEGIYAAGNLDDVRETIDAQRTMTFLHRHHTRLGHGSGSGGIDFGTTVKLTKP